MNTKAGLAMLLIGFVLAAAQVGCTQWGPTFRAKQTVNRQIDHVPGSTVTIDSRNGGIELVASRDAVSVDIKVRLSAGGRTQDEADQRLASTTLVVTRTATSGLEIHPKFPKPHVNGDGASVTVTMPSSTGDVTLDTSNGAIRVVGVTGELVADTSNGRVEIVNHVGNARVDTSNGPVTIKNLDGNLIADTSNGSVRVTALTGSARIDTSNGPITIALGDNAAGPLVLDSSNGSVTLSVGPRFAGKIGMRTSNGSVRISDSGRLLARLTTNKNQGSAEFRTTGEDSVVTTSNGSITLDVRQ